MLSQYSITRSILFRRHHGWSKVNPSGEGDVSVAEFNVSTVMTSLSHYVVFTLDFIIANCRIRPLLGFQRQDRELACEIDQNWCVLNT